MRLSGFTIEMRPLFAKIRELEVPEWNVGYAFGMSLPQSRGDTRIRLTILSA